MKMREKVRNERGLTLIEMLIAILIFILATVFIISLVSNALDKPKVAGIKGTLDYYETGASLLLHETVSVPDTDTLLTELNNDLDEESKFKSGKSSLVNAYNNPYKAEVIQNGSQTQTAVVVETKGKKASENYKMVVIKEGGLVESCTVGFGRNDKGLVTIISDLCGDQPVNEDGEEPEDVEGTVAGLEKGALIKFAGMEWTLLDPSTGYIHLNIGQGLGAGREFDPEDTPQYDPSDSNNIGYWLNTGWFSKLDDKYQGLVVERNWGIGGLSDNDGGYAGRTPLLSIEGLRDKESREEVRAKVGLLSVSEYREYSKYSKGNNGVVEYSSNEWMWMRTPASNVSNHVWVVRNDGELVSYYASYRNSDPKVRPALNIKSGTKVLPGGTLVP